MIEDVHVDVESYSKIDVTKVGSYRYAEDPSTEIHCLDYAIGNEDPVLWTPGRPRPQRLFDQVARGAKVYAWNAEFEIPMWEHLLAGNRCWPSIPLDQWRDTAILALSFALPAKLETCGEVLGLDVQKDPRGHHLIHKLCKPRRPSKHNAATRWTPLNVPKDFADLYDYCAQDVRSERAILHALPSQDLSEDELELWRSTVEMNLRGWTVDLDSVDKIIRLIEEHARRANAEVSEITEGKVTSGGQVAKTRLWLLENGVRMDDMKADTVDQVLRGDDHVRGLAPEGTLPVPCRRILEIRQEVAKASVKKYQAMQLRACRDGTVKNLIMHHGARTGRDAGRGIQIQNFVRATISKSQEGVEVALGLLRQRDPFEAVELVHGSIPHYASALLRPMLVARDGTDLYAADLSQIENRLASWFADCEYGIQIFRDGLDEYIMFATEFYGVDYDGVTGDQRQHCKHAVMGCQYGLAAKGLMNQAARFGQVIELSFAQDLVDGYRELYAEVPKTWYALEKAAKRTIVSDLRTTCGHVEFEMWEDFLMMRLPSGRELAYHHPKVEMKETPWNELRETVTCGGFLGQSKKWGRVKMIPGKIFGCVVQGAARDVMMHGSKATAAEGYDLVGRVHDELISQRDGGSIEEYVDLMKAPPQWLHGIPIEAEGWTGRRYRK